MPGSLSHASTTALPQGPYGTTPIRVTWDASKTTLTLKTTSVGQLLVGLSFLAMGLLPTLIVLSTASYLTHPGPAAIGKVIILAIGSAPFICLGMLIVSGTRFDFDSRRRQVWIRRRMSRCTARRFDEILAVQVLDVVGEVGLVYQLNLIFAEGSRLMLATGDCSAPIQEAGASLAKLLRLPLETHRQCCAHCGEALFEQVTGFFGTSVVCPNQGTSFGNYRCSHARR